MGSLIAKAVLAYFESHPDAIAKLIEALLPHLLDHAAKKDGL
jgi:hypothetical protein